MTSDVIPDDDNQKPTDEELQQLLIYDEIIETEREAVETEAAEHEKRWGKITRSHSVD